MTPHPDWVKRRFAMPRAWEQPYSQPFNEVADRSRGELRLAAEVAMARLQGRPVPEPALVKGFVVLETLARG